MKKLTSQNIDDTTLRVSFGDTTLFDYHYRPETAARFCPRPYIHPLRTLAGDVLSNSRPTDHPWHNGLSLTLTDVSGMNFWGGGTYKREVGQYREYPNVGRQEHEAWTSQELTENGGHWTEQLRWLGPEDELVFTETRQLSVVDLDPDLDFWRLLWESTLKNETGRELSLNSYASGQGLQGSGYTGLFFRMSRGYTKVPSYVVEKGTTWDNYHDGAQLLENEEAVNGFASQRLAHQGIFDGSLNGGLLLCEDLTPNPGYQHHWFYRPKMPCLAWSTAFHNPLALPAEQSLTFRHAVGIAAGFYTKEQCQGLWSSSSD